MEREATILNAVPRKYPNEMATFEWTPEGGEKVSCVVIWGSIPGRINIKCKGLKEKACLVWVRTPVWLGQRECQGQLQEMRSEK